MKRKVWMAAGAGAVVCCLAILVSFLMRPGIPSVRLSIEQEDGYNGGPLPLTVTNLTDEQVRFICFLELQQRDDDNFVNLAAGLGDGRSIELTAQQSASFLLDITTPAGSLEKGTYRLRLKLENGQQVTSNIFEVTE